MVKTSKHLALVKPFVFSRRHIGRVRVGSRGQKAIRELKKVKGKKGFTRIEFGRASQNFAPSHLLKGLMFSF